jgi:hypothetical protein
MATLSLSVLVHFTVDSTAETFGRADLFLAHVALAWATWQISGAGYIAAHVPVVVVRPGHGGHRAPLG